MEGLYAVNRILIALLIVIANSCSTQHLGNLTKENKAMVDEHSGKMTQKMEETIEITKAYIGMWVTKDGYIRHELLPNYRYEEARGNRMSAYRGSYKISGNHIDYKDDTGFTADGEFKDGILYHAGMVLYKEKK